MRKKSEFRRNSLILIIGTGLSQLIPLAIQPIVRRIFSDDDFGLFAQYYSLVAIISIIASLKYERSIVIPKDDRSAIHLLLGSILLNGLTSAVVLIILLLFGKWVFAQFGFAEELIHYVWLIPVSIFLISTNIAINFWLTRKKRFKGQVYNKTFRRATEAGSRVALGKASVNGGLIFGSLIGDFCNLMMSLFQFKRSGGSFKDVDRETLKENLEAQNEFPKFALFPAVLNVVSTHFPVFLLSAFYSDAIVGQFDGTREVLSAPLALVSISISQVLYQRIVDDINNGKKIGSLMRNNMLFLTALGTVGILIFYFFGEPIYTFIFGDEWSMAGKFSAILVFSYSIRFIVSPLTIVFTALKRLKVSAVWQICYFLLTLSLLLMDDLDIYTFLTYIVAIDLVSYAVYAILVFKVTREQDANLDVENT